MFSAYGSGGIVGPYLIGALIRTVERVAYNVAATAPASGISPAKYFDVADYSTAFFVTGIMCLAAAGLVLLIPKQNAGGGPPADSQEFSRRN